MCLHRQPSPHILVRWRDHDSLVVMSCCSVVWLMPHQPTLTPCWENYAHEWVSRPAIATILTEIFSSFSRYSQEWRERPHTLLSHCEALIYTPFFHLFFPLGCSLWLVGVSVHVPGQCWPRSCTCLLHISCCQELIVVFQHFCWMVCSIDIQCHIIFGL